MKRTDYHTVIRITTELDLGRYMAKLTLGQLERHLMKAADILCLEIQQEAESIS